MAPTFDDYVAGRGPALLRLAFLLCTDRHLAEDLTQDTLLRAHRRWKRLSALDHPDAYVGRVRSRMLLQVALRMISFNSIRVSIR